MPRSGSTYNSFGYRLARPVGGVTSWVGAERRAWGERLTAVARLLSVTRRPRTHALARIRVAPFTLCGDTRPSERQVASLAGKGVGHVFSVRRRTPPSSSAVKEPEALRPPA
jgi:hypothetical protein